MRFLYLSDTHLGARPMGYQQQPGHPELLPALSGLLREAIRRDPSIRFVLHGGDMVDSPEEAHLVEAARCFDLPVPTYLCLGNHDLGGEPGALEKWMKWAPRFFPGGRAEFDIPCEAGVVHVVPNHWGEIPYHWGRVQDPHFRPEQLGRLHEEVSSGGGCRRILATHSPVFGLPPGQTGRAEPLHPAPPSFIHAVTKLVSNLPGAVCVLGAHNHMNMCVWHEQIPYITSSAFVEAPFELKCFEWTPSGLSMETWALASPLGWKGTLFHDRAYVQGRAEDRAFRLHWGAP